MIHLIRDSSRKLGAEEREREREGERERERERERVQKESFPAMPGIGNNKLHITIMLVENLAEIPWK